MQNAEEGKVEIRPWYRSRIIWLGSPVFFFIIWSWWDSFRFVRALHTPDRVDRGTSIVSYISLHSRVGILGITSESIDYSKRQGVPLPSRGFTAESTLLSQSGWANLRTENPSPFQFPIAAYHKTDKEIETDYFYVAHWFLLLVYSGVWIGLYFGRSLRLRRACS